MPYEFDGEKYQKASTHQKEWGSKIIDELPIHGHERILDLGSGDGGLTQQLAERVPDGQVVGIDSSRSMIETARKSVRHNLTYVVQDIDAIDYRNEFDIIFSNAALHWILDHDNLLERVYNALRPGGTIRFNFAGNGNCQHFFQAVREAIAMTEFAGYFTHFEWPWFMPSADQYRILLEPYPYRKLEVWLENADRCFPNEEAVTGWIDQPNLVPFLPHVPENDKRRFRDRVVERATQLTQQPNGTYFETFRRLNVFAVK